jgi:Protein of unknown function (DUF2637)
MTTTNKEEHLEDINADEDFLAKYVTWALWALAIIVILATVTGQIESYDGLYIWFATHHITGIWADFAPLAVDGLTVVGELAIFAAIARAWEWKSRIIPWLSAGLGFCASVAANVGDKVQFHSIPTDLTGAVFPIVGAFGIVIGLGVLKRIAKDHDEKKAKIKPGLTPEQISAQLLKDNQELQRKLNEAPPVVLNISPEGLKEAENEEFEVKVTPYEAPPVKGLDVLIPPKDPTAVAPTVAPVVVSREEARRRQTAADRGLLTNTGQWQVIPDELA